MYSYIRGTYRKSASTESGVVILEAAGVGYEIVVPPIVEQEVTTSVDDDALLLLHVSALSSRDQPWPALFGFLRPEQRAFWDLLRSVPRMGGKGAARAMAMPVHDMARAIQDNDVLLLDSLPGITREGAEKIIAALRKKVTPFLQAGAHAAPAQPLGPEAEERQDAIDLLVTMGVRRLDAQRGVDHIVATHTDFLSVQEILTAYFREQHEARVS